MLGKMLPFTSLAGGMRRRGRRRERLTTALRRLLLRGLPCAGHKMINCHGLSGHHVFTTVGFNFKGVNRFYSYLLGFLTGASDSTGASG